MRYAAVLMCVLLASCNQTAKLQQGDPGVDVNDARATLLLYMQLRLENSEWKEYSKFIAWPDEPSWDCAWVVSSYSVGNPKQEGQKVVVPVEIERIGLYCYDFDFEPKQESITINYELAGTQHQWKVTSPIPDYPYLGADGLIKSLRSSAESPNEPEERRAQFTAIARTLSDARERSLSP